jgi:hypothetical protein
MDELPYSAWRPSQLQKDAIAMWLDTMATSLVGKISFRVYRGRLFVASIDDYSGDAELQWFTVKEALKAAEGWDITIEQGVMSFQGDPQPSPYDGDYISASDLDGRPSADTVCVPSSCR